MESLPDDDKKQKDVKNNEYLVTYTRHLEKRLRNIETERQLLTEEIRRLNQNIISLRNELERIKEPPLMTGTLTDILDDHKTRAIVNTSSNLNYVVSLSSMLNKEDLTPGANICLNQQTFAVVDILQPSKDPFVMSMEVLDAVPDISYKDIGGLEEQLLEVRETVEYALTKQHLFKKIGIEPPKGVLLHGPPGTGKTLIAKAIAHETNATFIRVIGSELVEKFIGEGARHVREIFQLAREKAPTILFIDELDAVAAERMDDATSGDREVQRTLMQLMAELDGFDNRGDVKIIGATNRADILDKALLRPGRFDRIIEFPLPDKQSREAIFKIYMKNLTLESNVNLKNIIELTEGATGADIKSICTEAGMFAIRNDEEIIKEDYFLKAIEKVMNKLKSNVRDVNLFI